MIKNVCLLGLFVTFCVFSSETQFKGPRVRFQPEKVSRFQGRFDPQAEKEINSVLDKELIIKPESLASATNYDETVKNMNEIIRYAEQFKASPEIQRKVKQLKEQMAKSEKIKKIAITPVGVKGFSYDQLIKAAEELYVENIKDMDDEEYRSWNDKVAVVLNQLERSEISDPDKPMLFKLKEKVISSALDGFLRETNAVLSGKAGKDVEEMYRHNDKFKKWVKEQVEQASYFQSPEIQNKVQKVQENLKKIEELKTSGGKESSEEEQKLMEKASKLEDQDPSEDYGNWSFSVFALLKDVEEFYKNKIAEKPKIFEVLEEKSKREQEKQKTSGKKQPLPEEQKLIQEANNLYKADIKDLNKNQYEVWVEAVENLFKRTDNMYKNPQQVPDIIRKLDKKMFDENINRKIIRVYDYGFLK